MRSSAQIQVSAPPGPVQSVLPLFDGMDLEEEAFRGLEHKGFEHKGLEHKGLEHKGEEHARTDVDKCSKGRPQEQATDLTKSRLSPTPGRPVRMQRASPGKAARDRDPLKQAQRVARQLRRGEFDASARQAAVNSLCQHLIDSLQSSLSRIHH